MKKFTSLLIGCCLALAGVAFAQQPEEQQSPAKKGGGKGHGHAAEAQPGAKPEGGAGKHQGKGQRGAKNEGAAANEPGAANQQGAAHQQGAGKGRKGRAATQESATAPAGADVSAQTDVNANANVTPGGKHQGQRGKGKNARGVNAKTSTDTTTTGAAATNAAPATGASPATTTSVNTGATGQQNAQVNAGGKRKRPEAQQVQQIRQEHTNFRAQARPDKVPAVTFNASYRIQGSDRWQGPQYEVFRSYRPERHDERWYRSHYTRVELIGGGYYYFHNGYWFPAWGYSPAAEYYAYDGPIYVGRHALPPDRVIADVQAVLQQMGYYRGEVDGLAGPLTREAVAAYQAENGLIQTAVIDEPTLDALGMS